MKISYALTNFLNARAADGYSPETLEMYKWALTLLGNFLADKEVEAVTSLEIQQFFAYLRTGYIPRRTSGSTEPLTPRSIENIWTAMRSFYNWLTSEELVTDRPDHKIARPKYDTKQIVPFTQDEITALLKACEYTRSASTTERRSFAMRRSTGRRDTAIVLVLLDTGLRVSECARLAINDVNLETGEIAVRPWGSGLKTKARTVYIGKSARRAIFRYLAKRDYDKEDLLFVTRDDRPMNRSSIRHVLDELGRRAGVPNVHPHRFRHTFAIQFLRNGGDVFNLQNILGHRSLDMVQHYLNLAGADSGAAHRQASPVDRWRL